MLEKQLFTKADGLLLALSGGVDSVVLAHLCLQAGYRTGFAHCNFQLRAGASDGDEMFVRELAKAWDVPLFVQRFSAKEYAREHRLSTQVAARNLRYNWFGQLMDEQGYSFLLTAHHADDRVETLLMNFFKGTGVQGLESIALKRGRTVRPLLFAFKQEIVAYARHHQLRWVEDETNQSDDYTRNYFRNTLIPGIEKVFPAVKENLLDNTVRFRNVRLLYEEAVEGKLKKLLEYKGSEIHIPVLKLRQMPARETLLFELLKHYGFSPPQVNEVEKLLYSESGRIVVSGTHRVLRNRAWLILAPVQTLETSVVPIQQHERRVKFASGVLEFRKTKQPNILENENDKVVFVSEKNLEYPLLLRRWAKGDYFYPFGMVKKSGRRGKKKVSKFLNDRKMSLFEKEDVWVLESAKRIVWVVGLRLDDRFRVGHLDDKILKIKFIPRQK